MTRKYFGTDGVRGCANVFPMTPEIAMKIGMAVGLLFSKNDEQSRVVIGKDTRISSYMIENALVAGFTAAGMNVFLIGPVPTPAVAMLSSSMRADVSVMISASHNPFYDNGIKLFGPDGFKLCDQKEKKIEVEKRILKKKNLTKKKEMPFTVSYLDATPFSPLRPLDICVGYILCIPRRSARAARDSVS